MSVVWFQEPDSFETRWLFSFSRAVDVTVTIAIDTVTGMNVLPVAWVCRCARYCVNFILHSRQMIRKSQSHYSVVNRWWY